MDQELNILTELPQNKVRVFKLVNVVRPQEDFVLWIGEETN